MRVEAKKKALYRNVWSEVRDVFYDGFLVSERGLQAALYAGLRKLLPSTARVVVEPTWESTAGKTRRPDLVVVEGEKITDVFELKFAPLYYPRWSYDIEKLREYAAGSNKFPVSLCKKTGHWDKFLSVDQSCLLHFVVVSHWQSEALSLKPNTPPEIIHWRGPTGDGGGHWDIGFS